jgi:hypothetical protein
MPLDVGLHLSVFSMLAVTFDERKSNKNSESTDVQAVLMSSRNLCSAPACKDMGQAHFANLQNL